MTHVPIAGEDDDKVKWCIKSSIRREILLGEKFDGTFIRPKSIPFSQGTDKHDHMATRA